MHSMRTRHAMIRHGMLHNCARHHYSIMRASSCCADTHHACLPAHAPASQNESYLQSLTSRMRSVISSVSVDEAQTRRGASWRVEMGEATMHAIATVFDRNAQVRGNDNFLIFAASMEVYRAAHAYLHVCTLCPKGDVRGCFDSAHREGAEEMQISAGLQRHWGRRR